MRKNNYNRTYYIRKYINLMKNKISSLKAGTVLKQSAAANNLPTINYSDCYCLRPVSSKLNALQSYMLLVKKTPAWINALLTIRNKLVRFAGLKEVGNLGALSQIKKDSYKVGDKLDFFTIDYLTNQEMLLSLSDRHLDIKMSVLRATRNSSECLYVTTWVKYNNAMGRVYMLAIMPFHTVH